MALTTGGASLALVAALFAPVTAHAAPGDLAFGVVRVDANANGVTDTGPVGAGDIGLGGVTVNAVDAEGNVVATTVTAADGSWSILEADVTGTPVLIEVVTETATGGNIYLTHPGTSADNAFARMGSPNRAAAPLTGVNVELNALVYPTWQLDAELADDPNGLGGSSILTGTPPFDADDSEPGQDSGTANARVRSADIVTFNWSLTAVSEDASLGDTFADAIFEQTISLDDGAVANFASLPAVCEAGSQIVANPSGAVIAAASTPPAGTTSVTLTCVLGEMGVAPAPSALLLATQVQPSASSPNGSTFETTSRFYAVDGNGAATARPADDVEAPPIEITGAPRYDIEKIPGVVTSGSRIIDGELVYGRLMNYTIQISTDRLIGVEAFDQPITVEDTLFAVRTVEGPNGEPVGSRITDLDWTIDLCTPTPLDADGVDYNRSVLGRIGIHETATAQNSVRDSGTCSVIPNPGNAGSPTLTFNGIDASGLSYPTQTVEGQPLTAGPYYVASYLVQAFIPNSELDRMQGAPDDGTGEMAIFNRVAGFDPDGITGASNFGSGTEPGYCETGDATDPAANCALMPDGTRSNNVTGPTTIRVNAGSFGKYLLDLYQPYSINNRLLPGSVADHDGAAQVQPGQAFTSRAVLVNGGTPMASAQMCDVFDNTMVRLVPLAEAVPPSQGVSYPEGVYSVMLRGPSGTSVPPSEQQARQGDWNYLYGHIDLSSDDPNTGVYDATTNRFEGVWTQQRAATNGAGTVCGSDAITWSETPQEDTNVVWARTAPDYVVPVGDSERWLLAFEQRDTYFGGPHAGEVIPAGTVFANYGAVRTSTLAPNWSSASYIPGAGGTEPLPAGQESHPGENGSIQGDRWTVVRAQMALQKRTVAAEVDGQASTGIADFGVTGAAVAGRPVVWEIVPTLTAASDDPAPVTNVVVTDTLPAYVPYNAAGTAELAEAGGFPVPTTVTENPDGTTTLVWSLGTRTPNEDLPVLRVATYADPLSPPNTTAVNSATITADGTVPNPVHSDEHTIRIEQSGEVQLRKSVDRTLDVQNDVQQYRLEVKNFSETLQIQAPTVIEVLPYNGDGTNPANVTRTPESDYEGSNWLNAAPVATEFDGTTPLAGTFFYTTVPGAEVPQRQQDDTDPSIWSTTFTPEATAFKFVADGPLATTADPSASGIRITFQTDQADNGPGDLYTDRFTAHTPTLDAGNQLLASNTVSVRVVGFSLGDLIWFDLDSDGVYTAGADRPAPAGVTVEVREASGNLVATTTTLGGTQEGRWVVNDLPEGDYYVTIPAAEFAEGGLLAGAIAAPGAEPDPNTDTNEDQGHHAIPAEGGDGGIRSAGLISLTADTDADPIQGEEPLGDNVGGLTLSPLTSDDFTNLTLDLALRETVPFTVTKLVDGAAAQYGNGPFILVATCIQNGVVVEGYPQDLTLVNNETAVLNGPQGAECTVEEIETGGATDVKITPEEGIILEPGGQFDFRVTNIFDAGSFQILKEVSGVGADLEDRQFTFQVACTFNGSSDPVFTREVAVTYDGTSGQLRSEVIDGLPVGSECTVTETGAGGADETPQPVQIIIDADPGTVQLAGFLNEFSAGSIEVTKVLAGAAQDDPFLGGLQYQIRVDCQIDRDGTLVDVYNGTLWVSPGDTAVPTVDGQPVRLPVGTHCWAGELTNQGAAEVDVNFDSYDNAAIVEAGSADDLQTLTLTVTNSFDTATLTVSKEVVGAGTGGPYAFELVCSVQATGTDGSEEAVPYPLPDADARFTLNAGESRTITVLAGASCTVRETEVPDDATVTYADSDPSTAGGASDGALAAITGTDNTIDVTNTYQQSGPGFPGATGGNVPPVIQQPSGPGFLGETGGNVPPVIFWTAIGLLLAGAILLRVSRRRRIGAGS